MKTSIESSIIDGQAWNLIWPTLDSELGHKMLHLDTNLPLFRIGMNDTGNRAGGVSPVVPRNRKVKQVGFGSGIGESRKTRKWEHQSAGSEHIG